ncbi:protein TASOR-like [Lampris incognitus]|uniref:protein TASOR-like n=1 Tax=Lampris incognitus TaxID=2546036 RepID=UPI0024B58449|nr:protein TASOR-like [Lampris incognitus]
MPVERRVGETASLDVGMDKPASPTGANERSTAAPTVVHRRHMPMQPLMVPIPKKDKEKRALFQYVATESREYEDMLNILTSSYIDAGSAGCFTYSNPQLVYSEVQEKEFVEKKKEMKTAGRTDKELEESYYFLLTDSVKLQLICEKGLTVGHSWITALGNPKKGVYLSKYSDILQVNTLTPGAAGEILIFKVMKGKVKGIYENMTKNLLDPTPCFDSHLSKNISKVTSTTSYKAFELTQQYFYEYLFDQLRTRPRQVCPYAIVSFLFKGKDVQLPSKTLPPLRLNSQSAEGSKQRNQFTVWSGDLVKGDRLLFQASLHSFSPPILPCRLPEQLDIGCQMNLDEVTRHIPSTLFSWSLYEDRHEVVRNGRYCSLLEVIDRSRIGTSVTRLLQELETRRVVLVTSLADRGFLFLLSSTQMTTANDRGEGWKRCLQALFVFPETKDMTKSMSRCIPSTHDAPGSGSLGMPWLNCFLPALHHALVKASANPPTELSARVEHQAQEYLSGQRDSKLCLYPMGEYDSKLDDGGNLFPASKHHKLNMEGYLHSYLYNPTFYLLTLARAKQMVELLSGPKSKRDMEEKRLGESSRELGEKSRRPASGEGVVQSQMNPQQVQQMVDSVPTCKKKAEIDVRRQTKETQEEGVEQMLQGRKRKLEQEMSEKTLKFLRKASLQAEGHNPAALGTSSQRLPEEQGEGQRDSWPFDWLALKLGLPTKCDLDLRKREELKERTIGRVSSLKGLRPSSHNEESAPRRGGGFGRRGEEEDDEIPWVLIPITGLPSERYSHIEIDNPRDPRCRHVAMATRTTAKSSQREMDNPRDPRRRRVATATCTTAKSSHREMDNPRDPRHVATATCTTAKSSHREMDNPRDPRRCRVATAMHAAATMCRPKKHPSLSLRPNEHHSSTKKHRSSMAPSKSTGVTDEGSQHKEEERRNQEATPSPLSPTPQPVEEMLEEESKEGMEEVKERGVELVEEREEVGMQVLDRVEVKKEAIEVIEILDDSPPHSPHASFRDIDRILQQHLGDFSSEVQHVLQGESIHYSAEGTDTLPPKPPTPFSHYMSTSSPFQSVQGNVNFLRHSIGDILLDSKYVELCQQMDADATLSSRISDFVAGIRAANASGDS